MKQMNVFDGGDGLDAPKDSDLTYDKKFKQLFTKREFLAPILLNVVPEYASCTLEEIEKLIGSVRDEVVIPRVYDSEDFGKANEMMTHYDVLVDCMLPDGHGSCSVNFFFDLEMQRENVSTYPLPKRGVYYCCRLISRQIEKLGEESYNQLKPVYSVWIIKNGIPKGLQNSIYSAGLSGHFNNGLIDASEINDQINLIHLCLIYLSEDLKIEKGQDDLIKYLNSVFTRQAGNFECNPYSSYSRKIEKEIDDMMTLEESVLRRGEIKGVIKGKIEGKIELLLDEGKSDFEIIQYLTTMSKNPLTEEQARKALSIYFAEENANN